MHNTQTLRLQHGIRSCGAKPTSPRSYRGFPKKADKTDLHMNCRVVVYEGFFYLTEELLQSHVSAIRLRTHDAIAIEFEEELIFDPAL